MFGACGVGLGFIFVSQNLCWLCTAPTKYCVYIIRLCSACSLKLEAVNCQETCTAPS